MPLLLAVAVAVPEPDIEARFDLAPMRRTDGPYVTVSFCC